MEQAKKPVYILTGFLGAGKTTLLNQMLQQEAWADTLVIVNEFGEVSLDHHLIENSSDTILELSNGCVCCSVRGELVDTLLSLDISSFKQVIIETTGLADPLPILQSLMMEERLANVYRPSGVITVVDVMAGVDGIEKYPEAQKQVVLADIIVLTKQDLVGKKSDALSNNFISLNQWTHLIKEPKDLTPQNIEKIFVNDKALRTSSDHQHTRYYQSVLMETDVAISMHTLNGLLQQMTHTLGEELLRLKGLVKCIETPQEPILVQISGGFIHAIERQEKWPDDIEDTKLVAITKSGDAQMVETIFNAFTGKVEIDRPDQAALSDNPLSVLGTG